MTKLYRNTVDIDDATRDVCCAIRGFDQQPKIDGAVSLWTCDIPPDTSVPGRKRVIMPHIWSWTDSGEMTEPFTAVIYSEKAATLAQLLLRIEDHIKTKLKRLGCSQMRQYYIEDVQKRGNRVYFIYGT